MSKILIIDDDVAICRTLQIHFKLKQYQVELAHDAESGLTRAQQFQPDVIVLDIRMEGRSGLEVLPELKAVCRNSYIIMITAFHDMECTIEAMQLGADDYIHKPIDLIELDNAVNQAVKNSKITPKELIAIAKPVVTTPNKVMIGSSKIMLDVFKTIGRVAKTPTTVLITGESGTGKELAARAIHQAGLTPQGPFIAINCAAMIDNLLESEMFGHEKGAFTGAVSRQAGKFELASNGTIFLDEVGELSPTNQAKLLRVLQEHEYTPVGGKTTMTTNARVLAATNRDLQNEVKDGRFREDLYYRLNVINIELPSLRQRVGEIEGLVKNIIDRLNNELDRSIGFICKEVVDRFNHYQWPGNVRELESRLTKAIALCPNDTLTLEHFPNFIDTVAVIKPCDLCEGNDHTRSLSEIEGEHVAIVLNDTNWHKGRACDILGVSRPRLQRLIEQYQLSKI